MQSIVSLLIQHSYFQLSILQQPIYCLYFPVVACTVQCSMTITVSRQRVILPMSIQQLQGFYISISSSCYKRRIPEEITSIDLRQRNQRPHHILFLPEDGNHQRRVPLLIPAIEVQLIFKPFNQIQDNLLILAIRNGQHQQILLLLEPRPRIHNDPQSLLIPLHQHLLGLLESKGREGIDNRLWQFAELQYFPHLIQRQQIVMGSYNSKQQELQYHSQHENAIYGKGTIFSSNKLPNCYVIKTLRLLHDEQIFKLFEEIQNNQNIYLLSLYGYIMGKSCQCQVERVIKKCVLTYWEFLSFSLKDCIEYRRRIAVPFHQNEIWHIIKAAVFGYASFERVNVYFEFQEEYLLINHEGRVRISWQHVQGRNEHLKYYKMEKEWRRLLELERGQSSGQTKGSRTGPNDGNNYRNLLWSKIKNQQLYYSPEQLRSIANLQPVHPQVKLLSIQHLHPRHAAPPPLYPPKPYVTLLQLLHHRLQQDQPRHGQLIVQDVLSPFADLDRYDAQLGPVQEDLCAGSQGDVRGDDERRVRDQSDGQSGQEEHQESAFHLMSLQSITQYNKSEVWSHIQLHNRSFLLLNRNLHEVLIIDIQPTPFEDVFPSLKGSVEVALGLAALNAGFFGFLLLGDDFLHSEQFFLQFGDAGLSLHLAVTVQVGLVFAVGLRTLALQQTSEGEVVVFGGGVVVPSLVFCVCVVGLSFLVSEVQPFALILTELSSPIVVNILRLVLLGLRPYIELTEPRSDLLIGITPANKCLIELPLLEGRAFGLLFDGLEGDLRVEVAVAFGVKDGRGIVLAWVDDGSFDFFELQHTRINNKIYVIGLAFAG